MTDLLRYDFGYEWPWTWGHALAAAGFAVLAMWCRRGGRPRLGAAFAILAAWGVAGAVILNLVLRFSLPLLLPTERFLPGGTGLVLDAGAGSGRSSLMVLRARPSTRVTALDIFGTEYGIAGNGPERLRANAAVAGVADRLDVRVGDMRRMPFAAATFDAAVSAFAIDHLRRDDVAATFREVARVVKPGGEFLLLVIRPDGWVRTALPFFVHGGYFGGRTDPDRWQQQLAAAGLDVVEWGTTPGTLYLRSVNRLDTAVR